ncbi:MAG: hypothetical protein CMH64_02130 [Nanoarchaeota archaeon]|nr:hypothetical protein [Nanoarchaeota archaeon]|tara:strand:- start:356 stop:631 length:276 start_codon:yes stop_codon:yes gene_type:complete
MYPDSYINDLVERIQHPGELVDFTARDVEIGGDVADAYLKGLKEVVSRGPNALRNYCLSVKVQNVEDILLFSRTEKIGWIQAIHRIQSSDL